MQDKLKPYDQPGKLFEETLEMLKADRRSLIDLHIQTTLPYFWLKSLIDGKVKNPSVNRIEFLNDKLKEQQSAE